MKKSVFPLYITDQSGQLVFLPAAPKRIVSLVPSQTELLCSLGLSDRLCGVTKFCVKPLEIRQTAGLIGGTKNPDLEKIESLKPDLIMGNMEENREADILELRKKFPVWMSDVRTLEDARNLILQTGVLNEKKTESEKMDAEIAGSFKNLREFISDKPSLGALFIIWKNPYMAAGAETYIHSMMQACGLRNVLDDWPDKRYPKLSVDEIKGLCPDVVLLSSEPYPFKAGHVPEFKSILPDSKVLTVDGEFFSWYGSRLLHSANYFRSLWQSKLSTYT